MDGHRLLKSVDLVEKRLLKYSWDQNEQNQKSTGILAV